MYILLYEHCYQVALIVSIAQTATEHLHYKYMYKHLDYYFVNEYELNMISKSVLNVHILSYM